MLSLDHCMCHTGYNTWCNHSLLLVLDMQGCSTGKKGVVYDFFFQYGPSVQLTNSDYWLNFDSGFDSSITGQSPVFVVLCCAFASMYMPYGHAQLLCRLFSFEVCQKTNCLHSQSHVLGLCMPVVCAPADLRLAFSAMNVALLYQFCMQFAQQLVLCLLVWALMCAVPLVTSTSGMILCRSSHHCQTPAHSVGH